MRRTDPTAETVRTVRERDDWRCARCAGWGPLSTQHRVARAMGGTRDPRVNLPGALLTLCGSGTTLCHGHVEHAPAWAEAHGYSVRRHALPDVETVPVWTWRGWVLLDHDGTLRTLEHHPGVPGCLCGCRPLEPATPGLWATPTS